MSGHNYIKSTNPFDDDFQDDVDDETFLKNSRRPPPSSSSFDAQVQSFQERRRQIEENTIRSTQQSLSVLRDSEQIGIATAEELLRQREKLERTDKQLDDINNTLRFSQKHINGIKSVFSSLKNYMSGRSEKSPTTSSSTPSTVRESTSNPNLENKLQSYDRYEGHPTTRLRGEDYESTQTYSSGSKDFSAKLDANLQEMCDNITRLKGLAGDLGEEIDSQNDLLDRINDKTDRADLNIQRQNKEMMKILKK
ncbi:synaptosomal-associated protein 29 [Anthonomus grandis grandis]|uniref:synaptosomal-associated protein 29 n=1 Tax=Anthonomus grandis grandis TaxID=2921223 RepID=UPI002165B3C0|nr:synaptosomal-associated protein 29 [Anthonomus grandis grandis]